MTSPPGARASPSRLLLSFASLVPALAFATPAPAETGAPAADLRLVACEESRVGPAPGRMLLRAVVKNAGAAQSQDATLHVKLLGASGAYVGAAWVRLDNGAVAPGAEEAFLVTIPDCPAYRTLVTALVWTTGFVGIRGNDFTTDARVEVGECLFRRCSNGDLLVTGKVRNGLAGAVDDVALSFAFKDEAGREAKTASKTLKGAIPPGAAAKFLWRIPECPSIASFIASVSVQEAKEGAAANFVDDLNAREEGLEAGAVRDRAVAAAPSGGDPANPGGVELRPAGAKEEPKGPAAPAPAGEPKPAPAPAPAAKPDSPAPPDRVPPPFTISVEGLEWVSGTFKSAGGSKNLKYTGDTAFLKLKILDAKDAPAQPEVSVVVKVVDRGQNKGFCKRPVTKASWKQNAEAITRDNAAPDLVAWHAKEGLLWVGLVTAEEVNQVDLTLDVSVEIKKFGTWTWKTLRDPYKTVLAPPEPEKKK